MTDDLDELINLCVDSDFRPSLFGLRHFLFSGLHLSGFALPLLVAQLFCPTPSRLNNSVGKDHQPRFTTSIHIVHDSNLTSYTGLTQDRLSRGRSRCRPADGTRDNIERTTADIGDPLEYAAGIPIH